MPITVSRRRWIIKEVYSCSWEWREARVALQEKRKRGKLHNIVENNAAEHVPILNKEIITRFVGFWWSVCEESSIYFVF